MMSKLLVNTLLIVVILFFSCKNSSNSLSSTKGTEASVEVDTVATASTPATPTVTEIYTWVNELRMREEPTTNSPIVVTLKEGEPIDFAGEKSDFTEKISLRGTLFEEPWLKVTTKTGKEGWVYGGGVKFYKVGAADKSGTPYDDCLKLEKARQISQANKCFERVQFRELKNNASRVSASASGIDFSLLSGEQLSLQNIGRDTVYDFRYYIKEMGFFAVLANYRDSSEYILVNDKSGELISMKGYPKASPEGNHIVGVGTDWKGSGGFNGIQIMSYDTGSFEVAFEETLVGYNPVLPKWIDDNTIQVTLLDESNRRKSEISQITKEETGKWVLR